MSTENTILEDWEAKSNAVARLKGEKNESDFGKGLTYCIGLFLCHSERNYNHDVKETALSWFNGASDHLYDLDTSTIKNEDIRKGIEDWKEKVIKWGHGFEQVNEPTEYDKNWAIERAKLILRCIDETMLGVETIKGR